MVERSQPLRASQSERCLRVVMYHYVRDMRRTRFPRLNALPIEDFRDQVRRLAAAYEMATLESALAFLDNQFTPSRDLCLLTFDDGLREHYEDVLPVLVDKGIQGLFFVITSCFSGRVVSVHKNHFLMATLNSDDYEAAITQGIAELSPGTSMDVDPAMVRKTYRWDAPAIARLKYLLNFQLSEPLRDQLLDRLFVTHLGDEAEFSRELYLSWSQAREMQQQNMLIGGHSHTHVALGVMDETRQLHELSTCAQLLHERLQSQPLWPFSYPYGQPSAFNDYTVETVRAGGFAAGFTTSVGDNAAGHDRYRVRRIDTNDVDV